LPETVSKIQESRYTSLGCLINRASAAWQVGGADGGSDFAVRHDVNAIGGGFALGASISSDG
jgi:hypothetical protein